MNSIVIGIPTFKRPELLLKLLNSIDIANTDDELIKEIFILVVDNDQQKSAEETVKYFKFKTRKIVELRYENCKEKGLSKVRNKILEHALASNPDYIVGIDDDEYVSTNWLIELLKTITENKADIVMGPIVPDFEGFVPKHIRKWFKPYDIANHQTIEFFESNNFIINAKFIKTNKLQFDDRFNYTGGEDAYFGAIASKKGAKIIWSKKSFVYEFIPKSRTTLPWLVKRKFRTSNVFTSILIINKLYLQLLIKLLKSLFYLFASLPLLFLFLFPIEKKYNGVIKFSEAIGGISALFNIKYNEY